MSRFFSFSNFRKKNLIKLRIEGPLNQRLETEMIQRLVDLQSTRANAILVVINSYGGPLQVAKNISAKLKNLANKNSIPIYCFAEQFCLNSANIIFSCGAKSYANKFSMVGDFGYVYTNLNFENFENKFNIRQNHISSISHQSFSKNPFSGSQIMLNNLNFIERHLKQTQQDLKTQILKNHKRKVNTLPHDTNESQFEQRVMNSGIIDLDEAVKHSFIDQLLTVQAFIGKYYPGSKIIPGNGKQFQNSTFQWIKSIKQAVQKRQI